MPTLNGYRCWVIKTANANSLNSVLNPKFHTK